MSGRASKLVQFHSGGDDFCPIPECEGLGDCIGGNPADGFVLAWRDDVTRKSKPGEKRIYALKKDEETGEVVAVGEGKMNDNGEREPMDVKVGDVVLYAKYAGTDIKMDGVEYKILSIKDALAIIE